MAEHNFATGIEMTMTKVVSNYLRWFELNRCKMTLGRMGALGGRSHLWRGTPHGSEIPSCWDLPIEIEAHNSGGMGADSVLREPEIMPTLAISRITWPPNNPKHQSSHRRWTRPFESSR